jgi:hypothetical protein
VTSTPTSAGKKLDDLIARPAGIGRRAKESRKNKRKHWDHRLSVT